MPARDWQNPSDSGAYGKYRLSIAGRYSVFWQKIAVSFKWTGIACNEIGFPHPRSGEYVEFEAPLPDYFETLLSVLRGSK